MKLIYLLCVALLCSTIAKSQKLNEVKFTNGLVYARGISWTENKNQDSIKDIIIEGDTMTAIRNLLVYCLQEKRENDNARIILSHINLETLKGWFKNKEFNYFLSEYKKVKKANEKSRQKQYPSLLK